MSKSKLIASALSFAALVVLAACENGGSVPAQTTVEPASDAPVAGQLSAKPARDECEFVREMATDLQRRKTAGMTEDEALAELSARGEYQLGYVVDGVFDAPPGASEAVTLHDIVSTCKRVKETGSTY